MTIAEARALCKNRLERVPRDILLVGILLLSSSASFGLGILAGGGAGERASSIPQAPMEPAIAAPTPGTASAGGQVVASENGTKYYLPSCSGAARISAANKVTFASADAAREAGYTPAANCPGP